MADGGLALIVWLSFITALSGAMSPGPLLTYTIIKTIRAKKRGYLMGFYIIIGHALIEFVILILLLRGFSLLLQIPVVVYSIAVIGGMFLIFMGISILIDIKKGKIRTDFLLTSNLKDLEQNKISAENDPLGIDGNKVNEVKKARSLSDRAMVKNPILGGAAVSASNPYWWIWWATIGFAFMVKYNIELSNLSALLFFLGHEMGDLVWYFTISIAVFYSKTKINKKIYYGLLGICGLFMLIFGAYLMVSILIG